jgi:hypothetical protein
MAFEVRAATEADRPEVAALVREMIPGGSGGSTTRTLPGAR